MTLSVTTFYIECHGALCHCQTLSAKYYILEFGGACLSEAPQSIRLIHKYKTKRTSLFSPRKSLKRLTICLKFSLFSDHSKLKS